MPSNIGGLLSLLKDSFVYENMLVDVTETDTEVKVVAEIPGVSKEDISVTITDNNILTIKAEKRLEKEDKGTHYHRVERSYGSMLRRIELPYSYEKNTEIKASYKEGVLTISLPKPPQDKGIEIPIE